MGVESSSAQVYILCCVGVLTNVSKKIDVFNVKDLSLLHLSLHRNYLIFPYSEQYAVTMIEPSNSSFSGNTSHTYVCKNAHPSARITSMCPCVRAHAIDVCMHVYLCI